MKHFGGSGNYMENLESLSLTILNPKNLLQETAVERSCSMGDSMGLKA